MSAHGPDKKAFDAASAQELVPVKLPDTMAFMFESTYIFKVTDYATSNHLDEDYYKCWQDLTSNFKAD
jgi:homogentisate 1,2-dioxygenase